MPNFEFDFLLILPLLGGYIYLTTFYYTKFQHSRIETQRLIFNSIIASLFLVFISYYFDNLILQKWFPRTRLWFKSLNPLSYPNLNLYILTLFISWFSAKLLNIIPTNILMLFVIEKYGDDFEKLYYRSMIETELEKKLIMITKDDGKVYVGYIKIITKPLLSQQIELVPFVSGYRESERKILHFTTPYFKVLNKLIKDKEFDNIDNDMAITISKDRIVTVSKFNPEVYKKFQKKKYRVSEQTTE